MTRGGAKFIVLDGAPEKSAAVIENSAVTMA